MSPRALQSATVSAAVLAWALLMFFAWSPVPYWPDADGYTSHVAEGRLVAHPPGYPFFVLAGHGFRRLGASPYVAVQAASAVLAIGGAVAGFFLARRYCGNVRASFLAGALAFSWVTLLIAQTGTSHAADLLAVTLLLLTAVRLGPGPGRPAADFAFAAAIVICAGFRFTTLMMMVPLFLAVAWHNRTHVRFWFACSCAGLVVGLVQIWVISQSGGYEAYSNYSRSMHMGNAFSSILLKGINEATMFNLIRALLWFGIGALPFLVVSLVNLHRVAPENRTPLVYGGLTAGGCLAVASLYLCTHPGYIAAAVPGLLLIAAVLWVGQPVKRTAMIACGFLAGPVLFLVLRPFEAPRDKIHAVANGLLLQYGAASSQAGRFQTTSGWLRQAGLEREIPANRLDDLRQEEKRQNAR